MGVSRRSVLTGALAGAGGLVVAGAGVVRASARAERRKQDLGPARGVLASLPDSGVLAVPHLQLVLVRYEPLPGREAVYADVAAGGLLALRRRCTHLGCRVPFCASSGWFECPCHGARFNRAGEYEFGPAPRGMDRYRLRVRRDPLDGTDHLYLDRDEIVTGPPRGTYTVDSTPLGPHCTG